MNPVWLARLQFGLTISFHYIFPLFSIGLGLMLVIIEGLYVKTRDPVYHKMTHFWVSVFALIFGIGVVTGIVMEFQFGTNWSNYSRFVGDVFGSALAAEGLFAFFLESGFLALVLFGWDRISAKMHYFSTVMVALGAHFSAVWIVIANSWQQTPAGFHIVSHNGMPRAEITDFWAMVFNPSSMIRLEHVITGAWLCGAFLVLSVSAFYLLQKKHEDFARKGMKIGLIVAVIASLAQLTTGHESANVVSKYQPAKLAAMEGHYHTSEPATLNLLGWVDEKKEITHGIGIPGGLGFLLHWDFTHPVTGLDRIPKADRPPVQFVFQSYHLMVAIGMSLIGLSMLGLFLWWRGALFTCRPVLWLFVFSVILPQLANMVGWWTAEVGRQPWVVWGLMRTSHGISPVVQGEQILASIILFSAVYLLLFGLFLYLLDRKIRKGPVYKDVNANAEGAPALPEGNALHQRRGDIDAI